MKSQYNKDVYVGDYALVMLDDGSYIYKPYNCLSANQQFLLRQIGYGPNTYKDRPLMKRILDKCYMIVDITGGKDPDYYEKLKNLFHILEGKGLKLIILSNFAGAKMGGKRNPVYFAHSTHIMEEWAKEMGIHKNLYVDIPPAKRFEREKKFVDDWTLFKVKPRVRFIPNMPGFDGIGFARTEWREAEGLHLGFKLSGCAKDTVLDFPPNMDWKDADLVIQEGGNKIKLDPDKFAELAGHSPTQSPEKRYSKDLTIMTKKGDVIEGRKPNFGLDLQATLGIDPTIDISEINKLLNFEFTDEMKEKYFMYRNHRTGELKLNNVGYEILERGVTLTNSVLRNKFYWIVLNDIRRRLKKRVWGIFGVAVPLELAPAELKDRAKMRVIVGYSGGIVSKAKVLVWNKLIYVESRVWLAMGRDFDGDLAFTFPFRVIPDKSMISDVATLKEWYNLPEKPIDEGDDRNDIDTLIDTLKQARLCGAMYNNGKITIDACRMEGLPKVMVTKYEIRLMAMVELFIHSFKGKVMSDKAPTAAELTSLLGVPKAGMHAKNVVKYFFPIRAHGMIKIDGVEHHPLEALFIRAKEANPASKSWWERVISKFKDLGIKSPKELEALENNNLKEDVLYERFKD